MMSKQYSPETYDAVMSLLKNGDTPSWRKVREITGHGASNAIVKEVRLIMSEIAERSAGGDYPKAAQDAFWNLWMNIKEIALGEFSQERDQFRSEAEDAKKAAQETMELLERAQERQAEREDQIILMREQLNQAAQREAQLIAQLTHANGRIDQELSRMEELRTAHKAEIATHDRERVEWQAKLEAEIEQRHKVVSDITLEHQRKVERLELELHNEQARYNDDTARFLRQIDEERVLHRKAEKEAQEVWHKLSAQLSQVNQEKAHLAGQLQVMQKEMDKVSLKNESLEAKNDALHTEISKLNALLTEQTALLHQAQLKVVSLTDNATHQEADA